MKHFHYFFVLFCFVLVTNSCQENGIVFPPSDNNPIFEVTIDGEIFRTSNANYVIDGDKISIYAIKSDTNEAFTLNVESYDVQSFSLEGVNNTATYSQNNAVSTGTWTTFGETSSRGNITFTDINLANNTVSGTFSFIGSNKTATSSKAFSNGSFSYIPRSSQPISKNSFTAKVDGVVFQEISLFANTITIGTNNLINVNANKSSSESISFYVNDNITPGEYDFGSFINQTYPAGQYVIDGDEYEADGKITIVSHDTSAKKISGTFNFDATLTASTVAKHAITEGSFSIFY
ncbi:DUF6252 domain-containing protein [Polaribacter sp. M15]